MLHHHRQIHRGIWGPDPPEKSQKYRVFCKSGPDPLKNHKATKPAFNVGPSSAHQQNAISMAFHWPIYSGIGPFIVVLDDGLFIAVFGSAIPSSAKKNVINFPSPLTKLSGFAHDH